MELLTMSTQQGATLERKIPHQDDTLSQKAGYRQWPIAVNHPASLEACVDIRDHGIAGKNLYNRTDAPPYFEQFDGSIPELFVRVGVLEKLKEANKILAFHNAEVFVNDSWRPAQVQQGGRAWCERDIRTHFPGWTDTQVLDEVSNFWAVGPKTQDDIDPLSPPPHSTGGALDLTLRRVSDGQDLWMGTIADDTTEKAYVDWFERYADPASFSDREAQRNRRLLYHTMTDLGFVVNPTEWWHVSWGDQLWACITSARTGQHVEAWYSVASPRRA
ncbi:MAG: peptidase M15D vanX D-ala-D-ala dipeptidase [Candidatus Pacebacteria bacterium]|nr:peptidase M15D vanX D-ala-D-ala dipeptidase [Candidatus Paceibacterota bacterium]